MMYAVLPVEVFSQKLSGSEWCVLGVLVAHKGNNCEAWPSVSRIAEITGMAQNNVSRALSSLEKSGMIAREKTGTRNRYMFPCLDHTAQHLDMVAPVVAENATTATDDNLSHVAKTEELPAKHEELPAKSEELLPVVVQSAPIVVQQQGELLPATTKAKRASRLPDDWQLPRSWGEWAMQEMGMTADAVRWEADKFADYWHSRAGQGACKANWLATWRNWIRKNAEQGGSAPQQKSKMTQALDNLVNTNFDWDNQASWNPFYY